MDETRVGEALLAAIGRRDWEGIGGCFADEALLRVLTPHQVREAAGRPAIVARYRGSSRSRTSRWSQRPQTPSPTARGSSIASAAAIPSTARS